MARDTLLAVIASVAIHLLLLGVLLFNFSRTPKVASMPEQPEIIQATVLGELETQVDADRLRREQEQQRLLDEEQRQSAEAQRLLQQEEEQRTAELAARVEREEQERQAEQRHRAEEEHKQAEAEKQRKAEEERKKSAAEKQRKAEEERQKAEAEKQRRAEEERKKAEAEKQRKAEEERKAAEERLKQQLAAEQTQRAQQQRSEWINAYVASITADIKNNWLRPLDSPDNFICKVHVVQSSKGEVLDVMIIESCGSPLLDRSVENAVRKASPLPPPPDPSVFDREINIRFRP